MRASAEPRPRRWAAVTVALALAGCGPRERVLLPEPSGAPPALQEACLLTERRCSSCHDLERIQLADWRVIDWPAYVERMRRQPGSGISAADGTVILSCLEHLRARRAAAAAAPP